MKETIIIKKGHDFYCEKVLSSKLMTINNGECHGVESWNYDYLWIVTTENSTYRISKCKRFAEYTWEEVFYTAEDVNKNRHIYCPDNRIISERKYEALKDAGIDFEVNNLLGYTLKYYVWRDNVVKYKIVPHYNFYEKPLEKPFFYTDIHFTKFILPNEVIKEYKKIVTNDYGYFTAECCKKSNSPIIHGLGGDNIESENEKNMECVTIKISKVMLTNLVNNGEIEII